jgi:hypothetical protein
MFFSKKVLSIVTSYSKYSRALVFENLWHVACGMWHVAGFLDISSHALFFFVGLFAFDISSHGLA